MAGVSATQQVTFKGQTYSVAQLKNLIEQKAFTPEITQEAMKVVKDAEKGLKVQEGKKGADDAQKAQAAAAANQQAVEQMQQTKEEAAKFTARDQARVNGINSNEEQNIAKDTKVLKEGLSKIDTKEKAEAAGYKHAKKIAKAAQQNIGSIDKFNAVEKIFTDKAEYEKAVAAAKSSGKWDENLPKYTLLEGKQLDAAKRMQKYAAKQLEMGQKSYAKYRQIYETYANKPDAQLTEKELKEKDKAFKKMVAAAGVMDGTYNASQMFDEKGNLNTKAYKDMMLEFAGSDFKGNLDERKALQKSGGLSKKRHTKDMYRAAGLDFEKDYTWAMKGGVLAAGVGSGALVGLLGGGAVAKMVATAVATAKATATANATATAEVASSKFVHWEASNGEEFEDFLEAFAKTTVVSSETVTTTAVDTATKEAVASISKGEQALRGAIGALPAAILSAALVKDNGGRDAFNGLTAIEVLKNAKQVRGKTNKELVNRIIKLPNITDEQKAAILTAAYGDNTAKKVNTRELLSAVVAAEYLNAHPEIAEPKPAEQQPVVEQKCEPAKVQKRPDKETKIANVPYKMQPGDRLDDVIAKKYGIKDPAINKRVRAYIRQQMGLPASGIGSDGKTIIPQIKTENGKILKDAYFLPEKLPDDLGGYKLDINAKTGHHDYKTDGTTSGVGQDQARVVKTADGFDVVRNCPDGKGGTKIEVLNKEPIKDEKIANQIANDANS